MADLIRLGGLALEAATAPLERLPIELIDHILAFVPAHQHQRTALALHRALPRHAISTASLWRHVRLEREGQASSMLALRGELDFRSSTRSVTVQAWREDPQALVDLLGEFPSLEQLRISVGPTNTPELLEELLAKPTLKWRRSIEELSFRFSPYLIEKSYWTFLKGAYFDIVPLSIANWPDSRLKRLSFVQDLLPTYGAIPPSIPPWGLRQIVEEDQAPIIPVRRIDQVVDKALFAQPLVYHRLHCINTLATSVSAGQSIESLVLRLPGRDILPSITAFTFTGVPLTPFTPFPRLRHLDLSTSHMISNERFSLLLRLYPHLETLTLDRCTGMIAKRDVEDPATFVLLRWLGSTIGQQGAARALDVTRGWKNLIKDRPTGVPAPGPNGLPVAVLEKKRRLGRSGYANMPRGTTGPVKAATPTLFDDSRSVLMIKDMLIIPPPPSLVSLGFGLLDLDGNVATLWHDEFQEGYREGIKKTIDKLEEAIHRYEIWKLTSKLVDRRMVTFRDSLPLGSPWVDWDYVEPDEIFAAFLKSKGLICIALDGALELLERIRAKGKVGCSFCLVPDCSGAPGVAHLALSTVNSETVVEREVREKRLWEEEAEERKTWRRAAGDHRPGCAHLITREKWNEED